MASKRHKIKTMGEIMKRNYVRQVEEQVYGIKCQRCFEEIITVDVTDFRLTPGYISDTIHKAMIQHDQEHDGEYRYD
jgi:hypothetical protein